MHRLILNKQILHKNILQKLLFLIKFKTLRQGLHCKNCYNQSYIIYIQNTMIKFCKIFGFQYADLMFSCLLSFSDVLPSW